MELVGALFTTLIGGGGAAAGAAGAGASALSALQLAGGVFSAIATIGSGVAANEQGKAAAAEHEFQAREEFIEGKETSAALRAELAKTIGNQAVAFAAGGVNLGSFSVQQAKTQAVDDAERELTLTSNQALAASMARKRAARNARAQGRSALFSSIFQAGGQFAGTMIQRSQRGVPA